MVRRRAKANGIENWRDIVPDTYEDDVDDSKKTDDKTNVLLLLWKDEDDGDVWAYEFTENATVREPWNLGIKLYPIVWLPWNAVKDSYHGASFVTPMLANQTYVNKLMAMYHQSIKMTAFPKYVYNKSIIPRWDNRVGAAIGVVGGDINNVAKAIDPASISPQVYQFIESTIAMTKELVGATEAALGETRPDNAAALTMLQKAAQTANESTKQDLYNAVEELFRIYLEFIGEYYGKRYVDAPPTEEMKQAAQFVGQPAPESVPVEFDFKVFKKHEFLIKLDTGASAFYSQIMAIQTLDNLLMNGHITPIQYLERIPGEYIPGKAELISEMKEAAEQQKMLQQIQSGMMQMGMNPAGMAPPEQGGDQNAAKRGGVPSIPQEFEPTGGKGYGALQRAINSGQRVL